MDEMGRTLNIGDVRDRRGMSSEEREEGSEMV